MAQKGRFRMEFSKTNYIFIISDFPATSDDLRWVAFVTADILPPPQKFLLLPQVPIIMVVSPSQIVFAWVARLCRFGPKREITPRNTHFRAYFKD